MSDNLKIREDKMGNNTIEGLTEQLIINQAELAFLLCKGELHRFKRSTVFNEFSSRSHTILKIILDRNGESLSCLTLCDLAGSERCTEAHIKDRQYFNELKNINQSLNTLGR